MEGCLPRGFGLKRLMDLPPCWSNNGPRSAWPHLHEAESVEPNPSPDAGAFQISPNGLKSARDVAVGRDATPSRRVVGA
jgi:hypothetical protein